MVPKVRVRKVDGGTGVVRPGATGICAILCAATAGAFTAASFADRNSVIAEYARGHMAEFSDYCLTETGRPVVTVRVDHSQDGAYGSITVSDAPGSAVFTAGATEPVEAYDVVVQFPTGGTRGTNGIKYRYSLNGGQTFSKILALGTDTTITIPDTGVTLDIGVGTIVDNEQASFTTTAPAFIVDDLPAGLEALRVTSSPFETVLIDMAADAATVTLCAEWLLALADKGKFKTIVLTARARDLDGEESESDYKDALADEFADSVCVDIVLCADVGDLASSITGLTHARPAGLFVAARGMKVSPGTDVAYVELGPLTGAKITDVRNNPKYHDENLFPGLDDIRLTALRKIDGFEGVYVNNANLLSPESSDFVFWQHARTLNRGCEIAYQMLTRQLSKGLRKNPVPGPNGERYIAEGEAQHLEELVNAEVNRELVKPGEVDDMALVISRTNDIRSNAGAIISCRLESVSLGYAKEFDVAAGFVTEIQPAAPAT